MRSFLYLALIVVMVMGILAPAMAEETDPHNAAAAPGVPVVDNSQEAQAAPPAGMETIILEPETPIATEPQGTPEAQALPLEEAPLDEPQEALPTLPAQQCPRQPIQTQELPPMEVEECTVKVVPAEVPRPPDVEPAESDHPLYLIAIILYPVGRLAELVIVKPIHFIFDHPFPEPAYAYGSANPQRSLQRKSESLRKECEELRQENDDLRRQYEQLHGEYDNRKS
jgi:hypothetical protein